MAVKDDHMQRDAVVDHLPQHNAANIRRSVVAAQNEVGARRRRLLQLSGTSRLCIACRPAAAWLEGSLICQIRGSSQGRRLRQPQGRHAVVKSAIRDKPQYICRIASKMPVSVFLAVNSPRISE